MTMAVIPQSIRESVEYRLRNNRRLVREARKRLDEAIENYGVVSGVPVTAVPSRSIGAHGDPTGKQALALMNAEQKMREAEQWAMVITASYKHFSRSPVADVCTSFFLGNMTMDQLGAEMGISGRTVSAYREQFVCYCAMLAIGKGLLSVNETSER